MPGSTVALSALVGHVIRRLLLIRKAPTQAAAVIVVGVAEHDSVDRIGRNRKWVPATPTKVPLSLVEAATPPDDMTFARPAVRLPPLGQTGVEKGSVKVWIVRPRRHRRPLAVVALRKETQ
jgi:hypothetical protein